MSGLAGQCASLNWSMEKGKRSWGEGLTKSNEEKKANKDMNHWAKSVIGHMVEGDESRASYSFSQLVDVVELLLQGHTCTSQDLVATWIKTAKLEVNLI